MIRPTPEAIRRNGEPNWAFIEQYNRAHAIDPVAFHEAHRISNSRAGMGDLQIRSNPYSGRWEVAISFQLDRPVYYKTSSTNINVALRRIKHLVESYYPEPAEYFEPGGLDELTTEEADELLDKIWPDAPRGEKRSRGWELAELASVTSSVEMLSLDEYDLIVVGYSGGKDSLASLLDLLERDVPPEKIELHHHDIDGGGEALMDWPCTHAYVKATAEALGVPLVFSWREGGFVREMMRDDEPTAPVSYLNKGQIVTLPTKKTTGGTRLKFPQVSADLSVRWCSAYLKIDVMARVLANEPRYKGKKILVVTGERREESSARAKYKQVEDHRTNTKKRLVHQWRNVIDWSEERVWEIIRSWNIRPHPAYLLGWGRTSCLACIFGDPDQWASVQAVAPSRFTRIADLERRFGKTIRRNESVEEAAAKGVEFVSDKPEVLRELAMSPDAFTKDLFFLEADEPWTIPPGAFKRCGGPT